MNLNNLLKNYITANINFKDPVSYRRVMMLNSMLSLFVVAFLVFTYINITVAHDHLIAGLDFGTAMLSIFTLWWLRRHKNVRQAAFMATLVLVTFMILFISKNENSHFGIIWSIFIPYFSTMFNGKKLGLYISIIFYSIMFPLAYKGIGVWSDGTWAELDFIRFVISAIILTLIIYLTESAHDQAETELTSVRASEKKILQELTELSITDALTKSYNRRYFNERVPHLLENAKKDKELISLFILDIDYFKEYNDTYGHYAGDLALQKVAQALSSMVEDEADLMFRIGGEEFAGIMHVKSKDETQEFIKNINQHIQELDIEHSSSELSCKVLTVSIGACVCLPTKDKMLKYFYQQADNALYQAKHEGRNKTILI